MLICSSAIEDSDVTDVWAGELAIAATLKILNPLANRGTRLSSGNGKTVKGRDPEAVKQWSRLPKRGDRQSLKYLNSSILGNLL